MKDVAALKMTLPKVPDIELVAIEGLKRVARYKGIEEGKIGEAKLVVAEAIINALEHSGEEHPLVKIEFVQTTNRPVIYVGDYGKGFDPSSVEDPDIKSKIGSLHNRGWGLKLMTSLSDGFRIESGCHGTRITITKLLTWGSNDGTAVQSDVRSAGQPTGHCHGRVCEQRRGRSNSRRI